MSHRTLKSFSFLATMALVLSAVVSSSAEAAPHDYVNKPNVIIIKQVTGSDGKKHAKAYAVNRQVTGASTNVGSEKRHEFKANPNSQEAIAARLQARAAAAAPSAPHTPRTPAPSGIHH